MTDHDFPLVNSIKHKSKHEKSTLKKDIDKPKKTSHVHCQPIKQSPPHFQEGGPRDQINYFWEVK